MAWRWARPRTTTDDDEDAIHLAFSTDRGGYKRWQAISSGTRRRGPPRHRGVRGKRSPARPSLVGTSQPPSRQPQESYDACARVEKTGFPGQFAHERSSTRYGFWPQNLISRSYNHTQNHEPPARPRRRRPPLDFTGDPHHGTTNAEPVVPTEPVLARQAHTAVDRFGPDRGVRRPDADPAQPRNATGVHGYGDAVASMASRVLYAIAATPSRVPLRRGVASTASRGRASRNRRRSSA